MRLSEIEVYARIHRMPTVPLAARMVAVELVWREIVAKHQGDG